MDSSQGSFVLISRPDSLTDATAGKSILFIEARISPDGMEIHQLQDALQARLSSPDNDSAVELGGDIMANKYDASIILGPLYEKYQDIIQSLKAVEYVGDETPSPCYTLNKVTTIKLQAYQLYDTERSLQDDAEIPQAEISLMPHARFDGQWEQLVFESDVKGELIWMMTNIVRFSQRSDPGLRDMNPVILLHGPPGTGKTTLCQGLAQKIAIRLNSTYKQTKMVQIKTATLLSKYYSESAKQVDKIFTTIAHMCQDDPERFICVLIDEVESIAFSRDQGANGGEAQDSLRATNSLLTGLDRAKGFANVVFLCTSNMLDSLDTAFLDRCGLSIQVDPPSTTSQYEILRGRIQKLVDQGHVTTEKSLPLYEQAKVEAEANRDGYGAGMLEILKTISYKTSGRSLARLPEQAILRYLRGEDYCDVAMALAFIKRFIVSQQSQCITRGHKRKHSGVDGEPKL